MPTSMSFAAVSVIRILLFCSIQVFTSAVNLESPIEVIMDIPGSPESPIMACKALESPIMACKVVEKSTRPVRLYSLKASDGTEYVRKAVGEDMMTCLASSAVDLTGLDIVACANAAAKAAMNTFYFPGDGSCTGFAASVTSMSCVGSGDNVVYTAKSPRTDIATEVPIITAVAATKQAPRQILVTWTENDPCSASDEFTVYWDDSRKIVEGATSTIIGDLECGQKYTVSVINGFMEDSISTVVEIDIEPHSLLTSFIRRGRGMLLFNYGWTASDICKLATYRVSFGPKPAAESDPVITTEHLPLIHSSEDWMDEIRGRLACKHEYITLQYSSDPNLLDWTVFEAQEAMVQDWPTGGACVSVLSSSEPNMSRLKSDCVIGRQGLLHQGGYNASLFSSFNDEVSCEDVIWMGLVRNTSDVWAWNDGTVEPEVGNWVTDEDGVQHPLTPTSSNAADCAGLICDPADSSRNLKLESFDCSNAPFLAVACMGYY